MSSISKQVQLSTSCTHKKKNIEGKQYTNMITITSSKIIENADRPLSPIRHALQTCQIQRPNPRRFLPPRLPVARRENARGMRSRNTRLECVNERNNE